MTQLEADITSLLTEAQSLWLKGLDAQQVHESKIRQLREQNELLQLEMEIVGVVRKTKRDPEFWNWAGVSYDKLPTTALQYYWRAATSSPFGNEWMTGDCRKNWLPSIRSYSKCSISVPPNSNRLKMLPRPRSD